MPYIEDDQHDLPTSVVPRKFAAFRCLHKLISCYELVNISWRIRLGVNANERLVLTHLINNKGLSAADLSRRLGISTAAMAGIVERMLRQGLIVRRRDESHGKRMLIFASEAALQTATDVFQPAAVDLEQLLETYPQTHQRAILRFLDEAIPIFEERGRVASRYIVEAPGENT